MFNQMRSFSSTSPSKKRTLYTFWSLQAFVSVFLFVSSFIEDVQIQDGTSPLQDDEDGSQQRDLIIATIVVLLSFVSLILHGGEFGLYIYGRLSTLGLLVLELAKTLLIEPGWALVIFRFTSPLQGNNLAPMVFVIFALTAYVEIPLEANILLTRSQV